MGGDHNTSVVGRFIRHVIEKRPENGRGVVVETDAPIGSGVTILKGVQGINSRHGRACIKDLPPYSASYGVPAGVRKSRFDLETILIHEQRLFPPAERLSLELETLLR